MLKKALAVTLSCYSLFSFGVKTLTNNHDLSFTVDTSGYIYLINYNAGIEKFDKNGNFVGDFVKSSSHPFPYPTYIDSDLNNNFLVYDNLNKAVFRLDYSGNPKSMIDLSYVDAQLNLSKIRYFGTDYNNYFYIGLYVGDKLDGLLNDVYRANSKELKLVKKNINLFNYEISSNGNLVILDRVSFGKYSLEEYDSNGALVSIKNINFTRELPIIKAIDEKGNIFFWNIIGDENYFDIKKCDQNLKYCKNIKIANPQKALIYKVVARNNLIYLELFSNTKDGFKVEIYVIDYFGNEVSNFVITDLGSHDSDVKEAYYKDLRKIESLKNMVKSK